MEDVQIPPRLIDVVAKQMYARSMRRRPYESGWYELDKEKRAVWMADALVVLEPIYREIADDLERRMLNREAVAEAVKVFNAPRHRDGEPQAPLEEALTAAFAFATGVVKSSRLTVERALVRFSQAVKENGGDLDDTSARIGPGEIALATAGLAPDKARDIAVGVAMGLLMAGDSEAEAGLLAITEDWVELQEVPA